MTNLHTQRVSATIPQSNTSRRFAHFALDWEKQNTENNSLLKFESFRQSLYTAICRNKVRDIVKLITQCSCR